MTSRRSYASILALAAAAITAPAAATPPTVTLWEPLDLGSPSPDFDQVFSLIAADIGNGTELFAAGNFQAGGFTLRNIARWGGSSWQPLGSGLNGWAWDLTTWDPDGEGPLPAQLVVGGEFNNAGGVVASTVARWDGSQWYPIGNNGFGGGTNGLVYAVTVYDGRLVIGGTFSTVDSISASNIAVWDGATWQTLGSGVNGPVWALTTWDPDGSGPQPAQLVAGGQFATAGGGAASRIARWDGSAWHPLGGGISGGADPNVYDLTTWDPDGDGPQQANLVAGGLFNTAGGVAANRIARWDSSAWHPFGSGMNNEVLAVTTWDTDGGGPQSADLVAAGSFTTAGGIALNHIARWDGSAWEPLGSGLNRVAWTLTTWTPDDNSKNPDELIVGGDFFIAGDIPAERVARLRTFTVPDTVAFTRQGTLFISGSSNDNLGNSDNAQAFGAIDHFVANGSGGTSSGIVEASIQFNAAITTNGPRHTVTLTGQANASLPEPFGGFCTIDLAMTSPATGNPDPLILYVPAQSAFSIANAGDVGVGLAPRTGAITGNILSPGTYAITTAPFGAFLNGPATTDQSTLDWTLTITPLGASCPADANGDNLVNAADLSVLLALFGQSVTPGDDADFNGDGLVNAADLSVLLSNFGTNCCPPAGAVVFEDATLATNNYQYIFVSGASGQTVTQEPDGGNSGTTPDPFRRVQTTTGAQVLLGHFVPAWTVSPASTPIQSVDFSIDTNRFVPTIMGYGVAALQDGIVYAGVQAVSPDQPGWISHTFSGLTQQDFVVLFTGQGSINFGPGGSPITFGIWTGNSSGNGITVGFDNVRIQVNLVAPPCGP